jgi:hypothetical protein
MKNILKITIAVFFALGVLSCKEVNTVVKPGDKPVIEAYLAPGQPVAMQVYTEIPYTTTDSAFSKPITGLKIKILNSNGKSFILEGDETGNYKSKSTELIGPTGTTVSMEFSYNSRIIAATTIMPQKPKGFASDINEIIRIPRDFTAGQPMIQGGPNGIQEPRIPINLTWENTDNVYHFVAAQSLEANPVPVVMQNTNPNEPNRNRAPRRFNNQPVQTTASSLQSQSFQYFGKYAVILYRLNPDYAALYVNSNTTSQNISTPIGTITNGLGIFTGVNADTLVVNVKKGI